MPRVALLLLLVVIVSVLLTGCGKGGVGICSGKKSCDVEVEWKR